MWFVANYKPVSLFSLKATAVTSSGGKTNLLPTFYAVKVALIDAAFKLGYDGAQVFPWIRDLNITFAPPSHAVVNHSFVKLQKEARSDGSAFVPSIGYREYVYYEGDLGIYFAIERLKPEQLTILKQLLQSINYFGKRGGFVQFIEGYRVEGLSGLGFSRRLEDLEGTPVPKDGVLQYLDDMTAKATFRVVNVFSDTKQRIGRDRVLVPVVLPYRVMETSRSFTWYKLCC